MIGVVMVVINSVLQKVIRPQLVAKLRHRIQHCGDKHQRIQIIPKV